MSMDCSLEDYQSNNRKTFSDLVYLLNQNKKWEVILHKLKTWEHPIYFNERILQKMYSSHCPSRILLNELGIRSCSVGNLMHLLEDCGIFDAVKILNGKGEIEITEQPGYSDQVIRTSYGGKLELHCHASGRPPLSYQWYKYNVPIKGMTSTELVIENFREDNIGDYYCAISNHVHSEIEEVVSNIVTCNVTESLPVFITDLAEHLTFPVGKNLELKVEVSLPSQCSLQWIKDNTILENQNNCVLEIKNVSTSDEGKYRCIAQNSVGEVYSKACKLHVELENIVQAKVALIIANAEYENHSNLKTPCNDVIILAEMLKKLEFQVITLINLPRVEMMNSIHWFFNSILPTNAYALFYYAGHGFEISNNKFMMPVDSPDENSFLMANCVCDQLLIQMAMKKKPKLLVTILDMCLKEPKRKINSEIFSEIIPNYKYTRDSKCNMVRAFATSSHQSAYENPESIYGIYMQHLSKYLLDDKPVVDVFVRVHKDISRGPLGEKQKPHLTFDDHRNCKLNDPVVEGDKKLEKLIHSMKKVETRDLVFPQLGIHTTVYITPHQGVILNAIDVIFDRKLDRWQKVADIIPEELGPNSWRMMRNGITLTLKNVQKVKSDICITVKLLENGSIAGLSVLDLGLPVISSFKLWFRTTHHPFKN